MKKLSRFYLKDLKKMPVKSMLLAASSRLSEFGAAKYRMQLCYKLVVHVWLYLSFLGVVLTITMNKVADVQLCIPVIDASVIIHYKEFIHCEKIKFLLRRGWPAEGKRKRCFIENNVARNDDAVGVEVETPIAFVIR